MDHRSYAGFLALLLGATALIIVFFGISILSLSETVRPAEQSFTTKTRPTTSFVSEVKGGTNVIIERDANGNDVRTVYQFPLNSEHADPLSIFHVPDPVEDTIYIAFSSDASRNIVKPYPLTISTGKLGSALLAETGEHLISPNGKRIAIFLNSVPSTVKLFELATGQALGSWALERGATWIPGITLWTNDGCVTHSMLLKNEETAQVFCLE